MKDIKVKMLLDSGAFGAWGAENHLKLLKSAAKKKGADADALAKFDEKIAKATIDIDEYIEYLKEHDDMLLGYVNLDVIVGTLGTARTPEELHEAARLGYENQQKIKKHGLRPMPVYHQGESLEWLARMIEDGEPYIGLSSAKDLWAEGQAEWLDTMFSLLTDREGRPLVKTHGFGITNPDLVKRYPWYTVDSTTWSLCAGFGQIIVPGHNNGKWDYLGDPLRIVISGVQQRAGSNQARQFEGWVHLGKKNHHELVEKFFAEVCDVSIAEVRYGPTNRRRCMLHYFKGLMHALKDVRYDKKNDKKGLLSNFGPEKRVRKALEKLKPVKIPHPNIMFATTLSREWSKIMSEIDADTRLLSYYELRDKKEGTLEQYVRTGTLGVHRKIKVQKHKYKTEHYKNFSRLNVVNRMQKGEPDGQEEKRVVQIRAEQKRIAGKAANGRARAE